MYCNKCGKQIDSGVMCTDCLISELAKNMSNETAKQEPDKGKEEPVYKAPVYTPAVVEDNYLQEQTSYNNVYTSVMPEPDNRMFGFGKALASTIMGCIGFIFGYVWFFMSLADSTGSFILALLLAPLTVISIIFGSKSIKIFKARKDTCAKPIATLILGIVGLSGGCLSALFNALLLLLAMVG